MTTFIRLDDIYINIDRIRTIEKQPDGSVWVNFTLPQDNSAGEYISLDRKEGKTFLRKLEFDTRIV